MGERARGLWWAGLQHGPGERGQLPLLARQLGATLTGTEFLARKPTVSSVTSSGGGCPPGPPILMIIMVNNNG